MRDQVYLGDDDCWMEITPEDEGFHIEIGSPLASYNRHMSSDDLRDLADAIMGMMG